MTTKRRKKEEERMKEEVRIYKKRLERIAEVVKSYGLPVDDSYLLDQLNTCITFPANHYKPRHHTKDQELFFDLMNDEVNSIRYGYRNSMTNSVPIQKIVIFSNGKKYPFEKDDKVLHEFMGRLVS